MNQHNTKQTKELETTFRKEDHLGPGIEIIKGTDAWVQYGFMCIECQLDENIEHSRDSDARCLICGAFLCGGHIMKHLWEEHCVGTHLYKNEEEAK